LRAFFAAGFLRALTAGLRFAADLRAVVAFLRAVVFFFRAEAFIAFGLRDAALRFAFLGFLDFVALAMIDLPIPLAILFKILIILARSYHYF
jgi:hypothetical protein